MFKFFVHSLVKFSGASKSRIKNRFNIRTTETHCCLSCDGKITHECAVHSRIIFV